MANNKSLRGFIVGGVIMALLVLVSGVSATPYVFSGNIASGVQYDLYTLELLEGTAVRATLVCDFDGVSRPLDPVLSAYFPGSDPSSTANSDAYNDDGFGSDDDPNGIDCDAFDSSLFAFTAPVTGTYTFRADGFGSSTGLYTLTISLEGSGNPFTDGRINPQQAAPFILYCDGTLTHVYSTAGSEVGVVEDGGTAGGSGWTLTPTADGRMLLSSAFSDGKSYYFVYDGCPHGKSHALSGDPAQVFAEGGY